MKKFYWKVEKDEETNFSEDIRNNRNFPEKYEQDPELDDSIINNKEIINYLNDNPINKEVTFSNVLNEEGNVINDSYNIKDETKENKIYDLKVLSLERKLLNLYIFGFNVDNINLKDILLDKYDDYDEKEMESLNNHLDEVDLESKCNNKNIKDKKK